MQCSHQTQTGIMSQRQCGRAATRDGYCTRHHPEYVAPSVLAAETNQQRDFTPRHEIPVLEALSRMGFDLNRSQRGKILVTQGVIKSKRYAFRYRVGDGHVLVRWGRIVRAKYIGHGVFVFATEHDQRGW